MLCILLREELRRFEEEDVHNDRLRGRDHGAVRSMGGLLPISGR